MERIRDQCVRVRKRYVTFYEKESRWKIFAITTKSTRHRLNITKIIERESE